MLARMIKVIYFLFLFNSCINCWCSGCHDDHHNHRTHWYHHTLCQVNTFSLFTHVTVYDLISVRMFFFVFKILIASFEKTM